MLIIPFHDPSPGTSATTMTNGDAGDTSLNPDHRRRVGVIHRPASGSLGIMRR
jgi:hypothetical protein